MLRKLVVGPYQANCYILACKETSEGLVIDPGAEATRILTEISRAGIHLRHIFLTHGHFDHTGSAADLKRKTGAPVSINALDEAGLGFTPDFYLNDGQKIQLGSYTITLYHTPGHSHGGMCFYAPGAVFSGDTLFSGSVGRTDFPGGSHQKLIDGVIKKIFPLGDKLRVYPGHGPMTTIGRERLYNPFFRFSRSG